MATKKGERLVWVNDLQRASDVIYEVLRFHLNHYNAKCQPRECSFEGDESTAPSPGTGLVEMGAMASVLDEVMRLGQYCYKDPEGSASALAEIADVILPLLEERAASVADPVANFAINRSILTLRRIQRDFGERWLGALVQSDLAGPPEPLGPTSIETSQWIA